MKASADLSALCSGPLSVTVAVTHTTPGNPSGASVPLFGFGETATAVVTGPARSTTRWIEALGPQLPRSSCASTRIVCEPAASGSASEMSPSTAEIAGLPLSVSAVPVPGAGVPTGSTKYSAAATVRPAWFVASAVAERCDMPGARLVGLGSMVIPPTEGPIRATMNVSLETSPQAPVESWPCT